ncbi:hypothetical protein MRX96_024918 [Rhipicephalus microplus]
MGHTVRWKDIAVGLTESQVLFATRRGCMLLVPHAEQDRRSLRRPVQPGRGALSGSGERAWQVFSLEFVRRWPSRAITPCVPNDPNAKTMPSAWRPQQTCRRHRKS